LARPLLLEAGFVSATVTGKSGDGGIDGIGVYTLSLVSFPIFFQCKRHKGSVGASAVRDFRGAMSGRGDRGFSSRRAASPPMRSWRRLGMAAARRPH
jgi:restriction system protein